MRVPGSRSDIAEIEVPDDLIERQIGIAMKRKCHACNQCLEFGRL